MGDRANIVVTQRDEQVSLYTHWYGSETPEILRSALIRGESRWDDFPYLTRIIFSEMISSDLMGTTGFGISQNPCDGSNIYVDVGKQTVSFDGNEYSFTEYVSQERKWDYGDEDD